MTEDQDKVTVGLTPEGSTNLTALMETKWFDDEVDAYRLAIAIALNRRLPVAKAGLTGVTTKYNRGTLDRDGRIRVLISALAPEGAARPYEMAELLADAGLRFLKQRLIDEHLLLSEVLVESAPAGP